MLNLDRNRNRSPGEQTTLGFEEYFDFLFPDEENKQGNLKILEMARKWKKNKAAGDA